MKLSEIASTVRSKNAGVNQITFDIIFPDRKTYERVVRSGAITRESIAKLYNIPDARISDFVTFEVGQRHQVHHLPRAPERQPGRLGHPRLPALRAAAGPRNSLSRSFRKKPAA